MCKAKFTSHKNTYRKIVSMCIIHLPIEQSMVLKLEEAAAAKNDSRMRMLCSRNFMASHAKKCQ